MTKQEFIQKYSFDTSKKNLKDDLNEVIKSELIGYEKYKSGFYFDDTDIEDIDQYLTPNQ